MLDITLTGVDDLFDGEAARHVAGKGQIETSCFFRDREKHLARGVVVDLDQIHASTFEQLNGRLAIVGGSDPHAERPVARRIIQNRSCGKDSRPEHVAG